MTSLRRLHLAGNRFTGEIPSSMASLEMMDHMRIEESQVSGRLEDLLSMWPNLSYLNVRNTLVTGTIPDSIVEQTKLRVLFLGPGLEGTIPTTLSGLTNLRELSLFGNELGGTFPTDIHKLSKLSKSHFYSAWVSCLLPQHLTHTELTPSLTTYRNHEFEKLKYHWHYPNHHWVPLKIVNFVSVRDTIVWHYAGRTCSLVRSEHSCFGACRKPPRVLSVFCLTKSF